MKRILHLSDLHFGKVHPPAIRSLQQFLSQQSGALDLIAVTGDWTQRARERQFRDAAQFLDTLRTPVLSVPGNHDLPLYRVWERIFLPFAKYDRHIRPRTCTEYSDSELAVVGLTTPHPWRPVEGILPAREAARCRSFFSAAAPGALRVIACHHPLFTPHGEPELRPHARIRDILGLAPHIVLSGHFHKSWAELAEVNGQRILHLSAGTAISNRHRGEVNGFHILQINSGRVAVATYALGPDGFIAEQAERVFELF